MTKHEMYSKAHELREEAEAIRQRELLLDRDPDKSEEFARAVTAYGEIVGRIILLGREDSDGIGGLSNESKQTS